MSNKRHERISSADLNVLDDKQIHTAKKARIQGGWELVQGLGLVKPNGQPVFKSDVFKHHGVSYREGNRILSSDLNRLEDIPGKLETRGRKAKLSNEQIWAVEDFLHQEGRDARTMNWSQLAKACDLDVSGITLRRAMGSMDYHHCIACQRGWASPERAELRVQYAKKMLERYSTTESWHRVRFSDEVHFGKGPQGKLRVIRQPGERLCRDCVQDLNEPEPKDQTRWHAWSAIGWNFKESLVWYDMLSESNGRMSEAVYTDQILRPVVLRWKEEGHDFVLEEDGHGGQGGTKGIKDTAACELKQKNAIETFSARLSCPDLSPLKNAWQIPEQHAGRIPRWDTDTVKELAEEAWSQIDLGWINWKIDSLPERLQKVVDMEGYMTGY